MESRLKSGIRETVLPDKMLQYFSSDETPLLKLKIVPFQTINKILLYLAIGFVLFTIGFIPLLIIFHWADNTVLLFVAIFSPIIAVLSLFFRRTELRQERVFCITNKRYYLHVKGGIGPDFVNYEEYAQVKAIIFRKRKYWDRMNEGTIDFIARGLISVENVPNFVYYQKVVESIFYEYMNIKEKWDHLVKETNFQLPFTITVSQNKLNLIEQRNKRLNIYVGLTFLITFLIGLILYLTIPGTIQTDISWKRITQILIISLTWLFGLLVIIGISYDKYHQIHNSSERNAQLKIYQDQLTLSTSKNPVIMPMSPTITLNWVRIYQAFTLNQNWEQWNDGILIFSSYDSQIPLSIGPTEDCLKTFGLLFCFFLTWKREQGFLLTQEQILEITRSQAEQFPEKIQAVTESTPPEEIKMKPVDPRDEIYTLFRNYLEPDEQIYLTHKPIVDVKPAILKIFIASSLIVIGIVILIFGGIEMNSNLSMAQFIVGFLMIMVSGMLLFSFIMSLFGKISQRKEIYVFSDQKIIHKTGKTYEMLLYTNILGIVRENQKTSYYIQIDLQQPFKVWLIEEYQYFIPGVPLSNNLIDNLKSLVKLRRNP